MALQTIPGVGPTLPALPRVGMPPALSTSLLIDATGEKIAFCGRVWNKDRTTKSVRKVGFLFGNVTKAGGSGLTVSLQDVSLTTGPMQPDETQDQTVAIANGDAGFTGNAWYQTGALSADRSVAFGELLAVVVEYDGSGRQGADSVILRGLSASEGSPQGQSVASLRTGGTWAVQTLVPDVILEFSDGTFGTLEGAWPLSAVGSLSFKQDTAGSDEYALEFALPAPCKVDGAWAVVVPGSTAADYEVVLYDGTTAMTGGTVSVDAHSAGLATGSQRMLQICFGQEISLAANTTYRLGFKPTQTTASITLGYFDVDNANHLQAHAGGTGWALTSRLDLGSWAAPTATRRPFAGVRLSAIDDGAGGGGGNTYSRGRLVNCGGM